MNPVATRIVQSILSDLYGRAGYDAWWDEIDKDIKHEIRMDLEGIVEKALTEEYGQ